ncbi:MAG: CotH kinase family protein [Verrucomicrobia bacterium]|nr:CotH kinase family protein [Verrucomicrobiota bacterium]
MTSNGGTEVDEEGDASDWFELWNPGPESVDLGGWSVSDRADQPRRWQFAPRTLAPHGFLLVYASGKDRQPVASTPVAPEAVPGLRLWLAADAIDDTDPEQIRMVGTDCYVTRWRDRVTGEFWAVQESSSSQPRWLPGVINGLPAVRFDGRDDLLRLNQRLATNDFCLWVVVRPRVAHQVDDEGWTGVGGVAGQHYLFGAQHGGDLGAGVGLSAGTNGVSVYEHGSSYMPAALVHDQPSAAGWYIVAVNYDARSPSLDVNGLVVRRAGPSPRGEVTAPVEVGNGAYGAFNGEVAEILLFDRGLSEGERRGLASYLAARYGLELPRPLHTSFALSADGEELLLTRPDGWRADHVIFGAIPRDISFGRQPDGWGAWRLFVEPTPGASNATPGATGWLSPPEFSHPGGFQAEPFALELTMESPNATIRFTLDGSEPTEASAAYTGPLWLDGRVGDANEYSMIPTVPGGLPPAGEVYKGWVVRARGFREDSLPSGVVTRSFWVHPMGAARYSLPVVSLATAPANLFDEAIGIYVPGNAAGGNYAQRGDEWERLVHVEFYEADGGLEIAQEGDVKIHGNTSHYFPIKGLDLDATGGRGRRPFEYRFFPDRDRDRFEHVMLRPTGHDQPTAFMRDELMQSLSAETGATTQAARACVVFINGEYWGLHYLKEKQDDEFVSYYGNVAEDELDYLEGYAAARAGTTEHYDQMLAYVAAHDLRDAAAMEQVEQWMEVDSYIDYKALEIFFYRWDIGNHRLWRPRLPDGRWRWLYYDYDVGWGGFWAEQPAWSFDMLSAVLTPDGSLHDHNNETTTFLLRRLIRNPGFRARFINRFADLLNTLLATPRTLARIDQMAAVLNREMPEHIARWRYPGSFLTWRRNIEYLRDYARRRPDACREHLLRRFGLKGIARLTLEVAPRGAGQVRLNSIVPPTADGSWTGSYFAGHPIELEARPQPGYRFAGWDGLPGVFASTVTLELAADWTLAARFEVDAAAQPKLDVVRAGADEIRLEASGPVEGVGVIERSADLEEWEAWRELAFDGEGRAVVVVTGEVGVGSAKFYRVRLSAVGAGS